MMNIERIESSRHFSTNILADSCQVENGGCCGNAICSHDGTTNAVRCTCKTGYTNTGSGGNTVCTGKLFIQEKGGS